MFGWRLFQNQAENCSLLNFNWLIGIEMCLYFIVDGYFSTSETNVSIAWLSSTIKNWNNKYFADWKEMVLIIPMITTGMRRYYKILFIFTIDQSSNIAIHGYIQWTFDMITSFVLVWLFSPTILLQLLYALCIQSTFKEHTDDSLDWNTHDYYSDYNAFWRISTGDRCAFDCLRSGCSIL